MRLLFFLFFSLHLPYAAAESLTGRVVKVADGDTVTIVTLEEERHKIRLF